MKPRTDRRPPSRRAPRVAAGLACLGIAVGIAAWLGGVFDRDPVPGDARPGAAPEPAAVAATDLAAAPRAVVTDAAWVPLAGRVTTPDGGPAAGAHVRVVAFPSGAEVWRGTADADGRFTCAGAPGTLYQAFVAPADAPRDETLFPAEAVAGEGTFVASLRSAATAGGSAEAERPAPARPTGGVAGQVVDEDGVGVLGATVVVAAGVTTEGDPAFASRPGRLHLTRSRGAATGASDGRFRVANVGEAGSSVSVTAFVETVDGAIEATVEAAVGAEGVRVVLALGPTTTLRCAGAAGRAVHVAARRPASMTTEEFDARAPLPPFRAEAWRFDAANELRLRGGDVRLPFVAYVGPSATDDRVAWFDGVPVGGEATMVLRAGRTVSGRLIGLPSTTGGRPQFEFSARAQGVTGLTVVGTLRGDRYEFRGLPEGTRWDLSLAVTTSGPDGRSDRYASAEGVAAGADLDLTLRAP